MVVAKRHVSRKHVLAVEEDLAGVRRLQQVDAAQKRALARAGGADDAGHLALAHGKVDVLEYFVRAEGLAQVPNVDDVFHAHASSFDAFTRMAARLSDCEPQIT